MNVDNIWQEVDKFFGEMHTDQDTNIHSAKCYAGNNQLIDRERQLTTSAKRMANHGGHNVNPNPKKRNTKKKRLTEKEIVKELFYRHIYTVDNPNCLQSYRIFCHCAKKGMSSACNIMNNNCHSLLICF